MLMLKSNEQDDYNWENVNMKVNPESTHEHNGDQHESHRIQQERG